ncbi:MAG: DUF6385 domain-containing protein [Defluviitaleaceae bacterium]|nr:DUF6385 domain-containing protein [Defluviitaleaceae bacterium]MCL2263020.1 DUF6385 domain-containing protein [Defluviitaleaceae bacterium]
MYSDVCGFWSSTARPVSCCKGDEKIRPTSGSGFFEKKILISGDSDTMESPWFYSGLSDAITFFVYNKGDCEITVHMKKSPDSILFVEYPQKIKILAGEIAEIIPHTLSKYVRLVVNSEVDGIHCEAIFQTQVR